MLQIGTKKDSKNVPKVRKTNSLLEAFFWIFSCFLRIYLLMCFLIWFLGGVFVDLGSIWSLYWDTCWDPVGSFCLQLYVKRDMCENINTYYGLAMSEPVGNCLYWILLGSFLNAF